MPPHTSAQATNGLRSRIRQPKENRLARSALVLLAILLSAPAAPASAQGPAPVGIRAVSTSSSEQHPTHRAAMRRRLSPTGKGAIIGAIVGAGYGYWATRSFERWGSDDGHPVLVPIVFGLAGMGVGALLGYVCGQD